MVMFSEGLGGCDDSDSVAVFERAVRDAPEDLVKIERLIHAYKRLGDWLGVARGLNLAGKVVEARVHYHQVLKDLSPSDERYQEAREGFLQTLCDQRFTSPRSPTPLARPGALQYALDFDGSLASGLEWCLHSLAEAVGVRIRKAELHREDDDADVSLDRSDQYQILSTVALHYIGDDSKIVIGFAEVPTTKQGLALMRLGYRKQNTYEEEVVLPKSNRLISRLIQSAVDEGRVVSALDLGSSSFSTAAQDEGSDYGNHEFVRALFGGTGFAEMNAEYLKGRNFDEGYVRGFLVERLSDLLGKDKVHVRPVGLGGGNTIYDVNANGVFHFEGYARAVAHPVVREKLYREAR